MAFPPFVFLAADFVPREAADFLPRAPADFVDLRELRDFVAAFLPALFRAGLFFADVFLPELFPARAAGFVFFLLEFLVDDRLAPPELFLAAAVLLLREDFALLPPLRPAALPATAPMTPPTTAPTGPATAPITAPVAAPAVCLEIGGMVRFSDDWFSG